MIIGEGSNGIGLSSHSRKTDEKRSFSNLARVEGATYLLLVTVAVFLLLISGTSGYRRRHAEYERKVFRELGDAAEVNEIPDSP